MPDVNSSGQYDKDSAGFEFLNVRINEKTGDAFQRRIFFAGNSAGSGITIKYYDDQGVLQDFHDGSIVTADLPAVKVIEPCFRNIVIDVAGSPDLNISGDDPKSMKLNYV